jgi:AAHS family 4-hydroxybenzoate transporter-like MFS transporter
MAESTQVDVNEVMEREHIGAVRPLTIALCALVALFDGFDLQIIGLAAPSIAASLQIPVAALGAVFSAAVAGMAVGGLAIAPLADRIGRRTVLVGAVVLFGVFTLATVSAGGVPTLLVYRFLTGLGLGTAVPCAISLASEFVPQRRRGAVAGLLFAGFPIGGVLAGLLGSRLLPVTGWQGLFVIGGIGPLVTAAVILLTLPESLIFLVTRQAPAARIRRTLLRVAPDLADDPGRLVAAAEERPAGVPVRRLFDSGRRGSTALLWVASFVAFGVLVVNSSWTPTLLAPLGVPVPTTALALALFNAGSVVATAAGGWLIGRFGPRLVLSLAFLVAAAGVAGVGLLAPSPAGIAGMQVLVGLGLGCASSGVIALAAVAYPAAIRSTGIGWALGLGRVGSFVGPLVVAALVAAAWVVAGVFAVLAVVCLVGGIAAAAMRPGRGAVAVTVETANEGAR